jgi:sigma-B regulation protein RsbU (phosphoserine phosphatase)
VTARDFGAAWADAASVGRTAEAMTELSESRVLIVDDVKANVDVLVQALRDDYKLSVALSGEAALRGAEKNPPDLVLLDIIMPGLDGYEVCRRLRGSPLTQEVPVMFLSSLEDVHDKARGFEAGANDYLTKPFEVLEVKARVRSLLKAKAYSDAVKEKLASELRIAREIQLGILPADVSASTRGTGLDVHAVLEPAREVGGDLYEVLRAGDDRVVVVIGDVSGKGIPAALFMAVTTTLIRVIAREPAQPEEILLRVNDALAVQNPRGMFVTLACAVFQPRARKVTLASAGHPSPLLLRAGQAPSLPFPSTGLVAGIMTGTEILSQSFDLQAGDTFLFYTDGVTEAFNAEGQQFGERRLVEHLAEACGRGATEAAAVALQAVRRHAAGHPQSDDLTIVAVHYGP